MDRALDDDALEGAQRDLAAALRASLSESGARIDEAAAEAVPVLEATLSAMGSDRTHTDRHEALALAALLGRRAVTLRLSPTATLALAAAVVSVARARGAALDEAFASALAACAVEGHVAAESEHVRSEIDERGADCVRAFRLAEKMLCVTIYASVGPDALENALDGVARKLLETDGDTCIAIVAGTPAERDERGLVSALASLSAGAMVVGARVIYVIESATLRPLVERSLVDQAVVGSLEAGLAQAGVAVERSRNSIQRLRGFFTGKR